MDVRMPGLSGLDLQEAFAKFGDSVLIVFLSGHGDIPTSVRAIKTGAVDFLAKPVAKKDLLSAVCGHAPQLERPTLVNRMVLQFLNMRKL